MAGRIDKSELTPEELEIWERIESFGVDLVRDAGAAISQADQLPLQLGEAAMNLLSERLAECRGMIANWMNDTEP